MRREMTEEEVTAFHEAAHAVFAFSGRWTRLHGPVVLHPPGGGDITMGTDSTEIWWALAADSGFDRVLSRIQLVKALLAGPVAERILADRGLARLDEEDLADASLGDYANVAEQLGKLDPPPPGLLERLEREVREELERPATWSAVERFAAICSTGKSWKPARRRLSSRRSSDRVRGAAAGLRS